MSGNQPTWNEDDDTQTAGDLYGAPKGTPRSGDVPVEPMSFVAPLSLDDEDPDASAELSFDEDEPAPAPRAVQGDAQGGLRLADEEDASDDLGPGNRPAEGARVVSASQIFGEDFIGAEGASDFLGLDTDFDPMPVSASGGGSNVDLRGSAASAVATEEEEAGYMSPLSPPEADPAFAAARFAGEEYDDEGSDELAQDVDEAFSDEDFDDAPLPARGRRGLVVAGAFVLGLAAVAAAIYGPGLFGGGDVPVEVASNGAGTNTAKPPKPPKQVGLPAEIADTEPSVDPSADPRVDPAGDLVPLEVLPEPIEMLEPVVVETDPSLATGPASEDPTAGPLAAATEPVEPPTALTPAEEARAALLTKLLAEAAEFERKNGASAGLLDLVWHGETVPIEAIGASSRVLTPAVGPVRVHMATLDVFDGRLFAVGENKVWIDLELGRVGLDGKAVEQIERLPREVAHDSLDAADLVVGGRVRARVPGGVIYGRIRSQSGSSVTLVTDSGARITLTDPILEPVGDAKSVVLKL